MKTCEFCDKSLDVFNESYVSTWGKYYYHTECFNLMMAERREMEAECAD